MAKYLIGIDLGTTNSALAYVEARSKSARPAVIDFVIPQLVKAGEMGERALLPSFFYLPGPHDLPAKACALPWDPDRGYTVGEFARNHGARVPGRLVTSAKSWLCHAGVDRTVAMLPWSAPPDVPRLSPVEASARFLQHMAEAWNHVMAKDHAEDRIQNQQVVLTVPASFDEVARNLSVEAARKAGLGNVTLLEEPQAAFYCWLAMPVGVAADKPLQQLLRPGMMCLVIDVGGGTSDFSLIQAIEQEGDLGFVRQAVGDHLLLGGDNMDLTLAKYVESKLPQAGRLDAASFGMLTQACRQAKEALLAPNPPAQFPVTVRGRGRQVIGGALHTTLTPEEVHRTLFDGFFPAAAIDSVPARGARTGLHEMGLPYVSDPAVTRHLAAFLSQHAITKDRPPDAILFNGGVFQPQSVRDRMMEVLRQWYDTANRPWNPLVLATPSLDLAVALGAAYSGWLRHTGGRRIGGGIARSYYLAVETGGDQASEVRGQSSEVGGSSLVPNPQSLIPVLCVVPQHLEEGSEITLEKPELELALGQPVSFPIFTSTVRGDDRAGQMLRVSPQQLLRLPPLHTILRGGKRSGTKRVPVTLAARLTEIGTLELFCVAKQSDNRWRLEFNTREIVAPDGEPGDEEGGESAEATVTDVWPEEKVQVAAGLIRAAYTEKDEKLARELMKNLDKGLEASRGDWPTGLCRRLWDFLGEVAEQRRLSPAHLGRWYNLVGYCLRPGFGDPLDKFRVDQLWKLLNAPLRQGGAVTHAQAAAFKAGEGGAEYWIMWRRVAGGLAAPLQASLFDRGRPVLLPSKAGKGPAYKPGPAELAEIWRAVASLERLDLKLKEQLGGILLKQVRRSPVPTYAFWSLTRLGSRALFYGPLNAVLHPHTVETWLEALLTFQPGNEEERRTWTFCLSQLTHRTGQRALDISDDLRSRVAATLRTANASPHLVQMVEEGGELESAEQKQLFGEALPIGLRLVTARE